ncbi:hypothetical protein MICAH_1100016 [Microcystis aeruginosa PCC 9809]|uniref:Uncharacterized protein n=1 Tax=Microcystis aeruginosa PCC 9809 TaxID=1160285 RepID=I4HGL0_MICAE|nr:hypothetical protein MICAH_1100016 [Microcystis aeruginosa PCC 9809]
MRQFTFLKIDNRIYVRLFNIYLIVRIEKLSYGFLVVLPGKTAFFLFFSRLQLTVPKSI